MHRVLSILLLPLCWPLYLLSRLARRDDSLVVFGLHTGSYSGNVRALIEEDSPGLKKVLISPSLRLVSLARSHNVSAFWRYSPQGAYTCLCAGSYVYSSYPSDINFWLSGSARLVNVWHGTPLKKIENDVTTGYYSTRNKHPLLFKIIAPYLLKAPDTLLVSSDYEEQCFTSAFGVKGKKFVRAFPPRLLHLKPATPSETNRRTILYLPTWRDDHSFLISEHLDLRALSAFLEQANFTLLIKRHPSDKSPKLNIQSGNIFELGKHEDVYQNLDQADIVVTDYSSVMFEALYLGKPVILFTPDSAHYQRKNRTFYIDPECDLKLPIATDQDALERLLLDGCNHRLSPTKLPQGFLPYSPAQNLLELLVAPVS